MNWRDDLSKKHGLNKVQEEKEAEEKRMRLKRQLVQEFSQACESLKEAQNLLAQARKILSLGQTGNHWILSLNGGQPSLALKLKADEGGFEIIEDDKVVETVAIFFHGDIVVQESVKNQPVDIDNLMGKFIKRLDSRIP